jgi:ParB family chromosome partitioning protein
MQNNIELIALDAIIPNPHQPRVVFHQAKIEELAESISRVGLLQPIVVRAIENGYELIAGERRYRASKHIGMEKIPAVVYDVNDIGSAALALVENIQREELNYLDEAISYKRLIEEHQLTQQQIAKLIGKSQSSVANKLRLLKHSVDVIGKIREYGLSERHSRALLSIIDDEEKLSIIEDIKNKSLNVRDTEKLIEMRNSSIRKKRQSVRGFIKNHKVYINTIQHAFQQVKDSGVAAHYDLTEDENAYIIMIKIEK